MKNILKNHPILIAILLGLFMTISMFAYQPKLQILTMLTLAILAGAAGYGYFLFM